MQYNRLWAIKKNNVIIIPIKDGENIERAPKKFKRKFDETDAFKESRACQQYNKPSVLKCLKMERVIRIQRLHNAKE